MDGGAWQAAVHVVAKSRARLSDFTFTFHLHALEKEMATHSSVLAWSIPGMAEPDGLLSRVAQSRTRLKRLSSSSSSSSPRREILMIMAFLPSPSIEHNLPFFKAQHPTSNFDSDDYLNFDKLFQGADSLNSPSTLHTFLQQL